jgi:hypothetical protein
MNIFKDYFDPIISLILSFFLTSLISVKFGIDNLIIIFSIGILNFGLLYYIGLYIFNKLKK